MPAKSGEGLPNFPSGTVTFLFTDIEGSTKLLEQLRDGYVTVLANQRDLLRAAFARYNGHEIDTQGDSFFVAFPRALDALNCVVEVQQALAQHAWPGGVQVRVRMGLHTGEPIVAPTGYVGMDVHRAARVAAAGHGGQVLLSQTTRDLIYQDLPPGVALRALGEHTLKDIRAPQALYQLDIAGLPADFPPLKATPATRASAVQPNQFADFGQLLSFLRQRAGLTQRELSIAVGYSDTHLSRMERNQRIPDQATLSARFVPALQIEHEPEWAARLLELAALARQNAELPTQVTPAAETSLLDRIVRGRLVGRQGELAELLALWARAQQGQAHLALISGEPGVGKTRLAREVQAQAQRDGAVVLSGGCYEFEAVAPYLPFVEALREWVEAQGPAALREALGAAAPEVARLLPEIEARLSPITPNPPLSPNEERLRLFDNLAHFLYSLASAQGLLIVLDDLHWADQATLSLLHYLLRRLREARVLVLAVYRETELDRLHPLAAALVEWNRERLATRVALGRLTASETGAMLAALFGQAQVSPDLAAAIHRETEGNPFFIEEVVKSLIEQGEIYRVGEGWERKAVAELSLPQSIKDAIGRRLSRLSPGCLEVLRTAAALGKIFAFGELAAVAAASEDPLLDALDEAGAAQLVRAQGGESFAFTHDKIREALYDELNPVRQRRLHQRIGEALEKLYAAPSARDAHSPDIAHHFIQSGDLRKGLAFSLAAAARARQVFALEEALRYYQSAAECAEVLDLPDQLAAIQENIGDIHFERGVSQSAVEHYQQTLTFIAPDDTARHAVLKMKIGEAYAQVGDERGLSFLHLAERELDPTTQTDELAHTLTLLGRYHHYHAQHRTAIELYERARRLAEALDRADTLLYIYSYMAGAYQQLAQFGESKIWARRSIALGERKNYPLAMASGNEFLAENATNQGYWSEALVCAARDREIGEKIGALARVVWADLYRAWALFGRGDLSLSLEAAQAALALAERIGEWRVAVLIGSLLARIETDLGQDDAARAHGELWLKRSDELGQVIMQSLGRHGLAYYHVQRGEWAEAAALYDQCAALYEPTENRLAPLWLGSHPALARLGLGRVDEAAQMITDYLALAHAAEAPDPVGCALWARGQILAAQGLKVEAQAAFDESMATLDKLGSRLQLGRALYHRGLFRRTLGQAEAAQRDLQRAMDLFQACGASHDSELAARRLR